VAAVADTTIARITGTALVPGVSRNGRLYTPEVIAKAAKRMQQRLGDPAGLPIVMRSSHSAEDDSLRIVGRVGSATVGEDGSLKYAADLYDTAAGRDIAGLATGKTPALRSTSIYGYWLGPVRREQYEGQEVSTCDDLEIDKIDFTATPGVVGALIDLGENSGEARTTESATGRTPVAEAFDSLVEPIVEDAPPPELAEANTAKSLRTALAKGQAMKNANGDPAYPIRNKGELRKAIKAVGRGGADHDAIRRHIAKRAAALGLSAMIPPNWNKDGSMSETATRYSDIREYYPDGPGGDAGFCIDAYNGPTSITIRNCNIDPSELRVIAAAAMDAVVAALQALDPDMDADIDVDGAPNADSDGDGGKGESAPGESAAPAEPVTETAEAPTADAATSEPQDAVDPPGAEPAPQPPAVESAPTPDEPAAVAAPEPEAAAAQPEQPTQTPAADAAESTDEESAVSETATPAAETATPIRTLTDEDLAALGKCFREALTADRTAATETAEKKAAKRAAKESKEAAKARKTAAETAPAPTATAPTAQTSESAKEGAETPKALDLTSLKETLLTEARDALRAELMGTAGAPARKGYRITESEEAKEISDEEAFERRADLLLGAYAKLPQPSLSAS
jgi:hypothetical protein